MVKNRVYLGIILSVLFSCTTKKQENLEKEIVKIQISSDLANHLAELPLGCIQVEYPNKLGQTLGSDADLLSPRKLRPAFYGCFDWHSSVHGHWSLVRLLNNFPELDKKEEIIRKLKDNITEENIKTELAFFNDKNNKIFERTYGWAWLLKLQMELESWDHPDADKLAQNLKPLSDHLIIAYLKFLPKLQYPIRTGDHPNTAFGLSFAYDYAQFAKNDTLKNLIADRAKDFYKNDSGCPVGWEPSGYDFLSPCLEEIGLMQRVLPEPEFKDWLNDFLPEILNDNFKLEPGKVGDRADGTLVHLDGLNFSRAWNLYRLAKVYPEKMHLLRIANEHISYSLSGISDENYEGTHWLGTFALSALTDNP